MTPRDDQLLDLFGALCNGDLSAEEEQHLAGCLLEDPAARASYVKYMDLHLALMDLEVLGDEDKPAEEYNIPPLSPLPSPLSPSFVGGPVFSYLVATVLLCVMLLGGWAYKITHNSNSIADNSRRPTTSGLKDQEKYVFVGRVTGLKDCRWSNEETPTVVGASVPLDREYALSSGLLEITYKSGARVILEGPCTYKVDSPAGGYLAVGKITARIDGAKPQAANPDSRNSSFIPHPSSFVVTTPTAIVTDLGTEFCVEVNKSGDSWAFVFQGKVEVRSRIGGNKASVVQLVKNESARVKRGRNEAVKIAKTDSEEARSATFHRRIPHWVKIETFNTGIGLKPGEADPHWQIVARSDEPNFQPRPAVVTELPTENQWLFNDPLRSQWISTDNGPPRDPDAVYTFRTTFELQDVQLDTVRLQGWFIADNYVRAIRLNGQPVRFPEHRDNAPFHSFSKFGASKGFIAGNNVLEIDVRNGRIDYENESDSPLGIRVELELIGMEE